MPEMQTSNAAALEMRLFIENVLIQSMSIHENVGGVHAVHAGPAQAYATSCLMEQGIWAL